MLLWSLKTDYDELEGFGEEKHISISRKVSIVFRYSLNDAEPIELLYTNLYFAFYAGIFYEYELEYLISFVFDINIYRKEDEYGLTMMF
jgi:hypothetical protein